MKRNKDKGEMDPWSERQSTLQSKIDKMKGLTIEMTFEYPGATRRSSDLTYSGTTRYAVYFLHPSFLVFLGFQ